MCTRTRNHNHELSGALGRKRVAVRKTLNNHFHYLQQVFFQVTLHSLLRTLQLHFSIFLIPYQHQQPVNWEMLCSNWRQLYNISFKTYDWSNTEAFVIKTRHKDSFLLFFFRWLLMRIFLYYSAIVHSFLHYPSSFSHFLLLNLSLVLENDIQQFIESSLSTISPFSFFTFPFFFLSHMEGLMNCFF